MTTRLVPLRDDDVDAVRDVRQGVLRSPGERRDGDPDVVSMPVGQIVGRMNEVRPVAEVIASLLSEYDEAVKRLEALR